MMTENDLPKILAACVKDITSALTRLVLRQDPSKPAIHVSDVAYLTRHGHTIDDVFMASPEKAATTVSLFETWCTKYGISGLTCTVPFLTNTMSHRGKITGLAWKAFSIRHLTNIQSQQNVVRTFLHDLPRWLPTLVPEMRIASADEIQTFAQKLDGGQCASLIQTATNRFLIGHWSKMVHFSHIFYAWGKDEEKERLDLDLDVNSSPAIIVDCKNKNVHGLEGRWYIQFKVRQDLDDLLPCGLQVMSEFPNGVFTLIMSYI